MHPPTLLSVLLLRRLQPSFKRIELMVLYKGRLCRYKFSYHPGKISVEDGSDYTSSRVGNNFLWSRLILGLEASSMEPLIYLNIIVTEALGPGCGSQKETRRLSILFIFILLNLISDDS